MTGTAKNGDPREGYEATSNRSVLQLIDGATKLINYSVQDILTLVQAPIDFRPSGVVGVSERVIDVWQKFKPNVFRITLARWKGDLNEVSHAWSIVNRKPRRILRARNTVNRRQVTAERGGS